MLTVPVIVCEDTRHTGQLIQIIKERYVTLISNFEFLISKPKLISVRDWNEAEMINVILGELAVSDVALVSDAGTPLISDPGFKIVRAARESGIKIVPIPGANAAITAMSASGLPTNKFMFWGFLPKKWEFGPETTHIVYESPVRAAKTLEEIRSKYPTAQIVIASELTKIHEYIGPDLQGEKGEVTILVYWK